MDNIFRHFKANRYSILLVNQKYLRFTQIQPLLINSKQQLQEQSDLISRKGITFLCDMASRLLGSFGLTSTVITHLKFWGSVQWHTMSWLGCRLINNCAKNVFFQFDHQPTQSHDFAINQLTIMISLSQVMLILQLYKICSSHFSHSSILRTTRHLWQHKQQK